MNADPEQLGDEIATLAAQIDAVTHRLLTCIRQFDESRDWARQGTLSCAHWLSWRIGLDGGTAREKVRVARALGALPAIDDALRRGKLSYAKVRALTRVANPENEVRLLDVALCSTGAQLERICRMFRRVDTDQMSEDRPDERRYVFHHVLPSGMVRIEAVVHPDEAAIVLKAIEAARFAARPANDVSADSAEAPPRPTMAKADALVKVAESFLATGEAAGTGGDRHLVLFHVEQDPLAVDGTLAATLDDGTRVSAETFRRICCDAAIVAVKSDAAGNPLDVGRRTRTIPPALRRALWSRDRGCRFPACPHKLYVHAHHIDHWIHGGETNLHNLVLLCSTHHRLLHEGRFSLRRTTAGELRFTDTKGRTIDPVPKAEPVDDAPLAMSTWLERSGVAIDAETSTPDSYTDPVDYDEVIAAALPLAT